MKAFGQKQPSRITIVVVAIGTLMIGFTVLGAIQYAKKDDGEAVDRGKMLGEAVYTIDSNTLRCESGSKPGLTGHSDDEKTSAGIRYMVNTPINYDATIAHPLLMAYAPAGTNRYESERFMSLTQEGTAAGFIVAYADNRRLSPEALEALAEIPGLIEKKWCIDKNRVFLTGHSDGGTIAMGIGFLKGTRHIPAAIAPSAMGIRGEDLKEQSCPNPLPVMLMHSNRDSLFPGYGKEAIQWWATCNGCDTTSPVRDVNGCVTYKGCKNNVTTSYCEGTGTHREWPGKNKAIIEFFRSSKDVR
jgi:polyhydroxybutyrate depolymerase